VIGVGRGAKRDRRWNSTGRARSRKVTPEESGFSCLGKVWGRGEKGDNIKNDKPRYAEDWGGGKSKNIKRICSPEERVKEK